ncbi:ABC-type nitrate/sulfonate/bicarbonate transport system, periplasmic component [Synechococcus sp. PCC 7502]|uniref:CmpA/NrtA family ABC transporter substrate-binding protein n=1 Tax=Synechococcus sp. PCC 7502 TaxID=1173263 RepID=UPI00029FD7BE|nr:CmpA/NrtA family ABC transporter substrate-binding protein [Synechococcus sp. PCC 7502]AFY72268.1 ABC-type nitrate/sulfonate/bicarbonate transport system, periplasmic component [Synechococcus sp. PCC 7502]
MSNISRRQFIVTAGASALGTVAANAALGQAKITPETTKAKLGFIALTDAAPLIIAKEKGYFAKHGMSDVEVLKQASWGSTRDNLVSGSEGGGIDGAHILSPMPYQISEGTVTNGKKVPMFILARLNINGQAISIANEYSNLKLGVKSEGFKQALAKAKAGGKELKVAVTFPGGTHDLWMRYWLAAGGINPDKDLSTIVIPPPQMVANMKSGTMEAFCVGEPWNARLVAQKHGYTALVTGELWKNHPEKAFAMRASWVNKHPKAAQALTMAVLEAQIWCDNPANHVELCNIIGADKWLKVPAAEILGRIQGKIDYGNGRKAQNSDISMKFWRDSASYPFKSHDIWFVTEDMRWGYFPASTNAKQLVDKVNREDIWRAAAKAIGQSAAIPKSTSRGVETFFDGVKFDPANPSAYLKSLKIKKV